MPTSAVGVNVEIERFNRFVPNGLSIGLAPSVGVASSAPLLRLGGMTVYAFDVTQQFDEFGLVVNGTQVADSSILTTGQHYDAPNGWKVIEANVPGSALSYDGSSATFVLDLWTRTPEDSQTLEFCSNSATWE